MSNFKFSTDLFLEKAELNRFQRFLVDDGFRLHLIQNSFSFGIIKRSTDSTLNNYKVEAGTNDKTVKIVVDSYALDKNGKIIFKKLEDNIVVPDDGQFHWIKIKHTFDPQEVGTVSIDVAGNLTGVNTKFTEVLRGAPNFPSKIKFINNIGNVAEYEVTEVTDDLNAKLSGIFTTETPMNYKVIGTFTPGHVAPTADKDPFQYDGVTLSFELETVLNTPPTKIAGEEFYLARVKVVGINVTIEDKRTEFWRTKADFDLTSITTITNPLIGIEAVKFDNSFTARDKNQVEVAWGLRTTNWTIDSALRRISVTSGEGGVFKTAGDFTTGDFDGWRVYAQDGTYKIISASVKSGTGINLTLQSLDVDDYAISPNDQLIIVPDVEEVEFKASSDGAVTAIPNIEQTFKFPVNLGIGKLSLTVPSLSATYSYNILYRYKKFGDYTTYTQLPDDAVGFYDESSFDSDGTLEVATIDRTRVPYTGDLVNGYIALTPNSNNFKNLTNSLITGDLIGIDEVELDNATPIVDLEVGTNRQYEYFNGTDLVLTADMFISLKKKNVDGDDIINGNFFILHFKQKVDLATFKLRIVQDFVNPTTFTLLKDFTVTDTTFLTNSDEGIYLRVSYDGTNWIINSVNETQDPEERYIRISAPASSQVTVDNTGLNVVSFTPSTTKSAASVMIHANFAAAATDTNPNNFLLITNFTVQLTINDVNFRLKNFSMQRNAAFGSFSIHSFRSPYVAGDIIKLKVISTTSGKVIVVQDVLISAESNSAFDI